MRMMTVYLSDAAEAKLDKIRSILYPSQEITDEKLVQNAITKYWLQAVNKANFDAKVREADKRLQEENSGLTDSWREYDGEEV